VCRVVRELALEAEPRHRDTVPASSTSSGAC
jgi:hypothetical protein